MKSFSRLVRINKSIKLLNNNKTSLMSICNELGFYDIPHFIKDFKIVCGITPQNTELICLIFTVRLQNFKL